MKIQERYHTVDTVWHQVLHLSTVILQRYDNTLITVNGNQSFRYKLKQWNWTKISITSNMACAWTRKTFWVNIFLSLTFCIETTGTPVKSNLEELGHVLGYNYDFLKVLCFSFAVPVVGLALSRSLCHRNIKNFYLALCAWANLKIDLWASLGYNLQTFIPITKLRLRSSKALQS